MKTGSDGTFLISWAQSEIDGLLAAGVECMDAGSVWRWHGQAVRIDEPRDVLILENREAQADLRRRAASQLRRFLGDETLLQANGPESPEDAPLFRSGFELTDGSARYQATVIQLERGQHPMILFLGQLPPCERDLWVLSCSIGREVAPRDDDALATICFVPGTRISTPAGPVPVEQLSQGDMVNTKDDGPQPVHWIGRRRISGGRLAAMPHLRPVRLAANVLSQGEPDQDLLVSPDHRVLVKGPAARCLFNVPEVLVCARDLVNDTTIRVDRTCRSVDYIHLMLNKHQVVWANGIEVDSFHPAGADMINFASEQLSGLVDEFPSIAKDAMSYGDFARRTLTRSEAALLIFGNSVRH